MNTIAKVVEQKTVVVEACGNRKKLGAIPGAGGRGEIIFGKIEGYKGDCAVMDEDEARQILRGEELTIDFLKNESKLKKEWDKIDDERAATKKHYIKHGIPEHFRHGNKINFRLAEKIPEKKQGKE